jgi:hypothetical protein
MKATVATNLHAAAAAVVLTPLPRPSDPLMLLCWCEHWQFKSTTDCRIYNYGTHSNRPF